MLGRLLTSLRCALVRAAPPVLPSTLAATLQPVRSLCGVPLTCAARCLLTVPTPPPAAGATRSITLETLHKRLQNRTGPKRKNPPLDGKSQMKGVVLKTLIKKPKKPNSANRRCVLVRLSNGKEMVAYVPGIGHNLQEHNIVLVRVGRLRDVPGVKIKCIRGKHDLSHIVKKTRI